MAKTKQVTLKAKKTTARKSVSNQKARHICIVTPSVIDHGSAYETAGAVTAIARNLTSAGHRVTLLWVPDYGTVDEGAIVHLKNHFYDNHLVELDVLLEARDLPPALSFPQKKSVAVYYHIKDKPYDGVYFALEGGLAYFSLVAQATGVFAPRPEICVIAQAPLLWQSEADRYFLASVNHLAIHHMEKMSLELADRVVCLSQSLKNWFAEHKWKLPTKTEVIAAPLPQEWRVKTGSGAVARTRKEIVVLAQWNFRDGLTLACDMLDELAKTDGADITVTVFGWFGQILGEHTGGMLVRRGRRWPFKLQLFPNASVRQIIEYVASHDVLVVIPAFDSASGFWAAACMHSSVPFITTKAGANSEVVPVEQRKNRVAATNHKALAALVTQALAKGLPPLEANREETLRAKWVEHAQAMARNTMLAKVPAPSKEPLVSIICVHYERPQYLLQAIAAIEQQTYSNIEVILVDDGSKQPDSLATLKRLKPKFKARGWKIIEQENQYLGAARNNGVKASRGEYVLFVDDDNALFVDAVRQFVSAMETSKADICTAFHKAFYDDEIPLSEKQNKVHYLPLGGSLDIGLIQDSFGDANAMVRRSVFKKIGLQNDIYGYTANDWEFFARAELAGLTVRVIPEPLYWYRSSTQGMYRTSHWYDNRLPILAAYRKAEFKGLEVFYHLAMAAFSPVTEIQGLRENLRQSESDRRYLQLCDLDANAEDAIALLAELAAAEGRPDTALILLAALKHKTFRYTAEERLSTEPLRGDGYKQLTHGLTLETAIDLETMRRFESQSFGDPNFIPLSYVEKPDKYFLQAKGEDISLALLPASCPSETVGAKLTVSLDQELATPAAVMLLLLPFHVDPATAIAAATSKAGENNSGWVNVPRGYTDVAISVALDQASTGPLNLVVAMKSSVGGKANVLACFSNISVRVSAPDRMARRPRLNPPPAKNRSRVLWPEEYQRARLLTTHPSTLPALLFAPDKGGIFLRPSEHGPVIALMNGGLPELARGILARVEVAHEDSSPFEFAIALCEPTAQVTWVDGQPSQYAAFSGWVRVDEKFKLVDIEARVQHLSKMKLDVFIAIRLPPGSSAAPANSFWRQFIILWDE